MRINISIDDISPRPDAGLECLKQCYSLIDIFPNIKFSLFIPCAYTRFSDGETNVNKWFLLHHPSFISELKHLARENFELGFHGYTHGNELTKSNNDEFASLSFKEASMLFSEMKHVFDECGLKYSNIFRPPAYRMSQEAIRAAKARNITLGLHTAEPYKKTYAGEDETYNRVIYVDSHPPTAELVKREKLSVVYHSLAKDRNFFNKERATELELFLIENECEFCFFDGLLEA